MPPLPIQNIVKVIIEKPAPLLLIDTCTILDIIRSPFRNSTSIITTAHKLVTDISHNPPLLYVVAAPLIRQEYDRHSSHVRDETTSFISKTDNAVQEIASACSHAGITPHSPIHTYEQYKLPDHLKAIADSLFSQTMQIEACPECKDKAYQRVVQRIPPATQGGQLPDCDNIEHYLELCHVLRANNYCNTIVFVSSNTNDYCEKTKPITLQPNLLSDFSRVNLGYATDLTWARSALGLQ